MGTTNYIPQAVATISNNFAITIMLNKSCDGVYYRYEGTEIPEPIEEAEILYTMAENDDDDSEPYFVTKEGVEYYLSNFMRI